MCELIFASGGSLIGNFVSLIQFLPNLEACVEIVSWVVEDDSVVDTGDDLGGVGNQILVEYRSQLSVLALGGLLE